MSADTGTPRGADLLGTTWRSRFRRERDGVRWSALVGAGLKPAPTVGDIPDAYLAALALEKGTELITTDRGFARFPGLKWKHPLDGKD